MQSSLILVTSTFPFGKGETFLETEIEYLCKDFSRVICIPTKEVSTLNKRNLPENCIVESTLAEGKTNQVPLLRIVSKLYHALKFSLFWKEILELWPNKINLFSLDQLFIESKRASLTAKTIKKVCNEFSLNSKNALIYTYWFGGTTMGSSLLEKQLKVITRAHRGDLYEYLFPHSYIPYRSFTMEKVHKVLPISKNGLDYLNDRFPDAKSKFELYRLGIKIPENLPSVKPFNNELTVVSCSYISKVKRVLLIAELLHKYTQKYDKKIRWHHFGDGPLQNELTDFVSDVSENLSVTLHGFKTNEAVLDWYRTHNADIFINLSTNEGIPVSIMEANSFRIPCIATNVGGTSELVSDSTGWLIQDPDSVNEMFKTLEFALSDKDELKQKGDKARELCASLFNADINYKEFSKFLKDVLNETEITNA